MEATTRQTPPDGTPRPTPPPEGERRRSSEEDRAEWQAKMRLYRGLVIEGCKRVGVVTSGVVLILLGAWAGRVELGLSRSSDDRQNIVLLTSTVQTLAKTVEGMQDRERQQIEQRNTERTSVLLELQKLNGQVESLRIEAQARRVAGRDRD